MRLEFLWPSCDLNYSSWSLTWRRFFFYQRDVHTDQVAWASLACYQFAVCLLLKTDANQRRKSWRVSEKSFQKSIFDYLRDLRFWRVYFAVNGFHEASDYLSQLNSIDFYDLFSWNFHALWVTNCQIVIVRPLRVLTAEDFTGFKTPKPPLRTSCRSVFRRRSLFESAGAPQPKFFT